jgi:uncharacterized protein YggE
MNPEEKKCECLRLWGRRSGAIRLLAIALTVLVLVKVIAIVRSYPYIGETNGPATISVSGTGDVVAIPNIATFDFSVTNEASDVASAQTKTTDAANAILAFLKKNGIQSTDIQTTDYSVYPRYNYLTQTQGSNLPSMSGTQVLAGYDVSESVEVKIRDLSTAGTILSGIGGLGATNVSGLTFTEDNHNDIVKQAEAAAITDAKTKAEALAKNLGVSLVRLVSYSNQNPGPVYYAASAMGTEKSVPDIAPGENKITENVTLVYEVR